MVTAGYTNGDTPPLSVVPPGDLKLSRWGWTCPWRGSSLHLCRPRALSKDLLLLWIYQTTTTLMKWSIFNHGWNSRPQFHTRSPLLTRGVHLPLSYMPFIRTLYAHVCSVPVILSNVFLAKLFTMQVMIELPNIFVQTIIYGLIVYSMIGFEWTVVKFFWHIFFMYFTLLYFTFYGMMTVAVTPNHTIAAIVSSGFYAIWNIFSGFIVPKSVSF